MPAPLTLARRRSLFTHAPAKILTVSDGLDGRHSLLQEQQYRGSSQSDISQHDWAPHVDAASRTSCAFASSMCSGMLAMQLLPPHRWPSVERNK